MSRQLEEAARELDVAVAKFVTTAAKLPDDPTDIAWSLNDYFGSFRFFVAQRAAQVRNAEIAKQSA